MIYIYATPQGKNQKIARAFAAGCGGKIVGPYPLQPDGDAFMFGALRGLLSTFGQALREGRLYYGDNGYFKPGRRISDKGFYRVTRNAMQHDGTGNAGPKRWNRLGMSIKPWRKTGSHIVVCPPARLHAAIVGFDADAWLEDAVATLKAYTDREFRVRRKMSWSEVMRRDGPSLFEDLKGAWALVTHSSNAAVEALLAGVPVFCTDRCAAYRMGLPDLARIEEPVMPEDRERWCHVLAANQWNLGEMADGTCWREMQEQL